MDRELPEPQVGLLGKCWIASTAIAAATEGDWNRLLDTGIKRDGKPHNPFMPIAMLRAIHAAERRALPPRPFGER